MLMDECIVEEKVILSRVLCWCKDANGERGGSYSRVNVVDVLPGYWVWILV